MEEGLGCLNCGARVAHTDAKAFAGVFVCPSCYALAERTYLRGEREIKHLLLFLKDTIRTALVEGKLVLSETEATDGVPKEELLRQIVRLQEASQCKSQGAGK